MKRILFIFSALFLVALFNIRPVYAGVKDFFVADVEIYGRAAFLLRISDQMTFSTSVHSHAKAECQIPDEVLRSALEGALKDNNRPISHDDSKAFLTIHVEYFGGKDQAGHCQVGFDVILLKRHAGYDKGAEIIESLFDYVNSVHLMKISGLIHADQEFVEEMLKEQVANQTSALLLALEQIRNIYQQEQK